MAPASLAATNQKANSDLLEAAKAHDELKVVAAIDLQTLPMAPASLAATNQKANSDLLEAVKAGDESEVVAALAQPGVDVNCCEEGYLRRTPLLLACYPEDGETSLSVIRLLLEDSRVNVNARDIQGQTALHSWGNDNLVEEILLSKRTDIDWNAADIFGQTPLLWFARMEHEESVRRLIGVKSVNLFATTIDAFTALHQVAERKTPFPDWRTPEGISSRYSIVDLVLKEVGRRGANVVSFVDATDILNRSALHYIAEEGCIEILELLCNFSANMNANGVDFHGFTPLHLAVRNGHDAVVERLLQLPSIDANVRATVNASNPDKMKPFENPNLSVDIYRPNLFSKRPKAYPSRDLTPLHFAAMDGRMEIVRLLLEWKGINIDAEDSAGLTPLHYSVQNGHSEVVELLLKKGKPFATLDYDRQCGVFKDLLRLATKREEKTVARTIAIQLLNTLGSRMNAFVDISSKFSGNQSFGNQSRLLVLAAVSNDFEIIKYIVKWQPEVNVNERSEWAAIPDLVATPLHFAVIGRDVATVGRPKRGHIEAVQELLEHPKLNVNAQDNNKTTPLLYAIAAGDVDMVKVLCQKDKFHRLNIDAVDSAGRTPLDFALMDGRMEVVRLLLKREGINIDAEDSAGLTALHYSVQNGHTEMMKFLLNKGKPFVTLDYATLDYNRKCRFFEDLLCLATKSGHVKIVQELLEHPKLDVNAEDNKKMTPLRYAIEAGNVDMVKVLCQKDKFHRLNIDAADNAGRTSLHFAVMDGRMEVVRLLLEWEGINIDAEDSAGLTALHYSVQNGHTEMMKLLLNKGKPFVTLDYATLNYNRKCHFFEDLLCFATKSGHVETVQELLENPKLDVNAEDNKKMTPLRYAIEAGNVDMVKVLCQKDKFHRLNIDAVDSAGRTPLHFAVMDGRMEVVRLLLEREGINIDAEDSVGLTALHYSVQTGHTEMMKLLLNKGKPFITFDYTSLDYNKQCHFFEDLLCFATKSGHVETVQELLEHPKLDVNAEDNKKMTPLRYAIEAGNVDMVKVLCQKDKFLRLNINAVDSAGRTPLHFAVMDGCMEVVRLLLEQEGINIDAEDSAGLTPVHYSIQNGRTKMMKLLLNKGKPFVTLDYATLDYNRKCLFFEDLLCLATKSGHVKTVRELLEHPKLDVNAEDNKKMTPLRYAIEAGNVDMVKVLCRKDKFLRLNIDAVDSAGRTPLHFAVMDGRMEVVRLLLEQNGINIDAEDSAGLTALHYSVQNGHTEMMKLLLNKGKPFVTLDYATVDYNKKCRFFEDLLCLATKNGHVETVQELLEHPKLDVNAEDNKKMTPLRYAIEAGNVDMVKVLCQKDNFHRLRANEENSAGQTPLEIVVEDNNLSENPNKKAIEKVLLEQPEVKDFVDRLYRDRQVFVDAANALLVGAALIASVTFAGWLQPPLGYTPDYDFSQPFPAPPGAYESYAAIKQNPKVKAFWVFNSLSFFFAIATVLAGADAAMPSLDDAFIGKVVKSVRRSLIVASILLVMSVVCVLGAFASGGLAVLPPVLKYDTSMIITVCVGGTVCMIILAKFLWKLAKAICIRVLKREMKPKMLVVGHCSPTCIGNGS